MSENTTVIVSKKTRDALKALGRKGESYDSIILSLINNIESLDSCQEDKKLLIEKIKELEAEG